MDVRCASVFYCLFFGGGVSMDYGGVLYFRSVSVLYYCQLCMGRNVLILEPVKIYMM